MNHGAENMSCSDGVSLAFIAVIWCSLIFLVVLQCSDSPLLRINLNSLDRKKIHTYMYMYGVHLLPFLVLI